MKLLAAIIIFASILILPVQAAAQSQNEADTALLQMYYICGQISALVTIGRFPSATVDDLIALARRDCEGPRSALLKTRFGTAEAINVIDREFAEQVADTAAPYILE